MREECRTQEAGPTCCPPWAAAAAAQRPLAAATRPGRTVATTAAAATAARGKAPTPTVRCPNVILEVWSCRAARLVSIGIAATCSVSETSGLQMKPPAVVCVTMDDPMAWHRYTYRQWFQRWRPGRCTPGGRIGRLQGCAQQPRWANCCCRPPWSSRVLPCSLADAVLQVAWAAPIQRW